MVLFLGSAILPGLDVDIAPGDGLQVAVGIDLGGGGVEIASGDQAGADLAAEQRCQATYYRVSSSVDPEFPPHLLLPI